SALSKVVSAGTLVPVALAAIISHATRMPRAVQIAAALLAIFGAAYVAYMLASFLPIFVPLVTSGEVGLGPRSVDLLRQGCAFSTAWPYVLQDIGILLLLAIACRL